MSVWNSKWKSFSWTGYRLNHYCVIAMSDGELNVHLFIDVKTVDYLISQVKQLFSLCNVELGSDAEGGQRKRTCVNVGLKTLCAFLSPDIFPPLDFYGYSESLC